LLGRTHYQKLPVHMEENKINLDAPAFGAGSQTDTSETTTETSQVKELGQDDAELVTRKVEETSQEEESEEEQKIPYSRFKAINDEKRRLEQEKFEANERYERLLRESEARRQEAEKPEDEKLLGYMIKLIWRRREHRASLTKWNWNV